MRRGIVVGALVLAGCGARLSTQPDATTMPQPVASTPSPAAETPAILSDSIPAFYIEPLDACSVRVSSNLNETSWPLVEWALADRADPLGTARVYYSERVVVPAHGSTVAHPDCCFFGLEKIDLQGGPWKWRDYGDSRPVCY